MRGTSPLTAQQPTIRQGANAWIDGIILFYPSGLMGYLISLCGKRGDIFMEFFHAEIYWSGYGKVITNVLEIPNPNTGTWKRIQDSFLLEIFLNDSEVKALKDYLGKKFDTKWENDAFEIYMKREFYVGTPIDSWFDIEKFKRICIHLEIEPKFHFYTYSPMEIFAFFSEEK